MIVKTITNTEHLLLQPTTKRGKIRNESEQNYHYNPIVAQPTTKRRKVRNKNEQTPNTTQLLHNQQWGGENKKHEWGKHYL